MYHISWFIRNTCPGTAIPGMLLLILWPRMVPIFNAGWWIHGRVLTQLECWNNFQQWQYNLLLLSWFCFSVWKDARWWRINDSVNFQLEKSALFFFYLLFLWTTLHHQDEIEDTTKTENQNTTITNCYLQKSPISAKRFLSKQELHILFNSWHIRLRVNNFNFLKCWTLMIFWSQVICQWVVKI